MKRVNEFLISIKRCVRRQKSKIFKSQDKNSKLKTKNSI